MPEFITDIDRQLFFLLNGLHNNWLDQIMYYVTNTYFWLPLYAWIVYLLYLQERKNLWLYLVGMVITIVLTDQITSGLMKPYFQRLRPSRDPEIAALVHIVNDYRGGLYGFASSHAANTFGIATYLTLAMKARYPLIGWMFLWASFVSYSRIYLGVHYPGDILAGATVGAIAAWAVLVSINAAKNKISAVSG